MNTPPRPTRLVRDTAMVLALATSLASAQATPATLSLGDAARLAALRSAPVVAARHRAEQADGRVTQRRADLLPNVSASAVENGRTLNTATFGIDFPSPPGQPPSTPTASSRDR